MNESQFQKLVKDKLKSCGFFVHVNFDAIRGGVPDIFCTKNGIAYLLELKYVKKDFNQEIYLPHPLSAQQSHFLRNANIGGGVLIGFNDNICSLVKVDDIKPGPNKKFCNLSSIDLDEIHTVITG